MKKYEYVSVHIGKLVGAKSEEHRQIIDEYAKKVAMKNYPDIIQCGDAFELRNEDWAY